jgi:hypothetical protein
VPGQTVFSPLNLHYSKSTVILLINCKPFKNRMLNQGYRLVVELLSNHKTLDLISSTTHTHTHTHTRTHSLSLSLSLSLCHGYWYELW